MHPTTQETNIRIMNHGGAISGFRALVSQNTPAEMLL